MIILTLLIILILSIWTILPLFTKTRYRLKTDQVEAVLHQHQQIQGTLDDLQLDYETGKLSHAEYQELVAEQTDQKKDAKPEAAEPVCPDCGNAVSINDKFCSNCGRKLGFHYE